MAWMRCLSLLCPLLGCTTCRDRQAAVSTGHNSAWPAVTLHGTNSSSEQVRQEQEQAMVPAVVGLPSHQRAGSTDRG